MGEATAYKIDDLPKVEDLFADQTPELQQWFSSMLQGPLMIKKQASYSLNASQLEMVSKMLTLSVVASGVEWQCTNFPDMMLGKVIIALTGSTFVAGCPISSFEHEIRHDGLDITQICDQVGHLSREQIVDKGGFFAFLSPCDGVCIPHGFITFQCNVGCVEFDGAVLGDGGKGADLLVPWLPVTHLYFTNVYIQIDPNKQYREGLSVSPMYINAN